MNNLYESKKSPKANEVNLSKQISKSRKSPKV